jgi:hypothetical protein
MVAAFQRLSARHRGVLLLVEVASFPVRDAAEALGMTTTAAWSALQRPGDAGPPPSSHRVQRDRRDLDHPNRDLPENTTSLALHQRHRFRHLGVRERVGQHHGRWRGITGANSRCHGEAGIASAWHTCHADAKIAENVSRRMRTYSHVGSRCARHVDLVWPAVPWLSYGDVIRVQSQTDVISTSATSSLTHIGRFAQYSSQWASFRRSRSRHRCRRAASRSARRPR